MRAEIVLMVVALAGVSTTAAEQPPSLEVSAPKTAVSVGDRVVVQVIARGETDLLWGAPSVATTPSGPWEFIDGPREVEGARPPAWELILAPMEVGELDLPQITATVRTRGGEAEQVIAEKTQKLTVASVLPVDEEAEPAPLKGPIGVRGFPWEWVLPFAVPILGLAAVAAWWGYRRRRSAVEASGPGLLPPLAEFEALAQILEDRIGREPAAGICDRLAAGLRLFLERRCQEPAQEMTSFELRLLARKLGWPESVQRDVLEVTGVVDRVRFGRQRVDAENLRRSIQAALNAAHGLEDFLAVEDQVENAAEVGG